MPLCTPYEGTKTKLVLAFDVGTTYSGISYCILEPSQVPQVKGITKFPAQDLVHGPSKIPSVIYYDKDGAVRAIGAEALCDGMYEKAQEEAWIKVEWFKLQFCSSNVASPNISVNTFISPLPPEKSAVEVLADYYKYLLSCAREFIQESVPDGESLWKSVKANGIHFVLPHPNGWGELQQCQMRKAAIKAKLVKDRPSRYSRISFVTEGEASLHFALSNGLPLGSVSKTNLLDVKYKEISVRRCHLEGSMFVSRRLENLLHDRLRGSKFAEDVAHMAACFDKHTKLRFKQKEEPQYIKFGAARDNDEIHEIRFGQLKVTGDDIASCFEPAVNRIVNDIEEIIKDAPAHTVIKRVILVDGLATNDWLYHCYHSPASTDLTKISTRSSKAVADGAISFHLTHAVQARVVATTYGARVAISFNRFSTYHERKRHLVKFWPNGTPHLNAFSKILSKGTLLGATERRHESKQLVARLEDLTECTMELFRYDGELLEDELYEPPAQYAWMDEEENEGMYTHSLRLFLHRLKFI
ncbi:hypothetical protein D9619_002083 [Psilocybe cf. subviscida]|uniref:Uncharacterized protein n=1 Tax=Psilocybe cf. subviscida TaxID=2480587 RepID=A0A8H5BF74_9AGAR|nr:hypothetical protein D9619_002083 [Psilocybe cf. subviscida]